MEYAEHPARGPDNWLDRNYWPGRTPWAVFPCGQHNRVAGCATTIRSGQSRARWLRARSCWRPGLGSHVNDMQERGAHSLDMPRRSGECPNGGTWSRRAASSALYKRTGLPRCWYLRPSAGALHLRTSNARRRRGGSMVHQVRSAHWRQRRRLLSATALVVPFLIIGALSLLPATVVTRLPLEPAVSHPSGSRPRAAAAPAAADRAAGRPDRTHLSRRRADAPAGRHRREDVPEVTTVVRRAATSPGLEQIANRLLRRDQLPFRANPDVESDESYLFDYPYRYPHLRCADGPVGQSRTGAREASGPGGAVVGSPLR